MSTFLWLRFLHVALIMSLTFPEINSTILFHTVNKSSATSTEIPLYNGTIQLHFKPTSINELIQDCNATVYFNCSLEDVSDTNTDVLFTTNGTYYARVVSQNGKKVQIVIPDDMFVPNANEPLKIGPYLTPDLEFPIKLNGVNNFTIQAMSIGYVKVVVTIFGTSSLVMGQSEYKVTILPRPKTADFVFDCSAAAVAILISFGIGCVTDTENLKRQLKHPVSLIIGFCCQFLLMPVVGIFL